ncbi:hypothetical protein U1Q18_049088, partial [Sarracenia purpurea var. burkii]
MSSAEVRRACAGRIQTVVEFGSWSMLSSICREIAASSLINVRENKVLASLRWGFSTQELKDLGLLVDALTIGGVGQEEFVDGLASKGGTGDGGGAAVDDYESLRTTCVVFNPSHMLGLISRWFPRVPAPLSAESISDTRVCSIIDVPGYFLPLLPPLSAVFPLGAKDIGDLPSEALGGSFSILSTSP